MDDVVIEKLVHGGQGLGTLPDGRKVFIWNALPGETVRVELHRQKKSWAEGVAVEVLKPSPERQLPREDNFLATSPWQILPLDAENRYKSGIVQELFAGEHVDIPGFKVFSDGNEWGYRNKMEYSFYGDDDGVHLALYGRGTHGKNIVEGSVLAMPALDAAARAVVIEINRQNIRAGDLKTVVVRASKTEVAATLYIKQSALPRLQQPAELAGLRVYYSDPKSPASVPTKHLYTLGSIELHDTLLGNEFLYDADSFFQVNVPVFQTVLERIKEHAGSSGAVDMYGGVGSIGLSLGLPYLTVIELHAATAAMARRNAKNLMPGAEVIESPAEKVLDFIQPDDTVIFDPPRAGLHKNVVHTLTEVRPPKIVYLSCNPATQARDLGMLKKHYEVTYFEVFNFFPHTPHIESLAILERL